MSRSDRAAKGFLTGLIQYATQIAVQAFLAPLVLIYAGREALGAFAAISQVLGLLGLVDIAHSWSLERFLGQALGATDGGKRFRDVFTTARTLLLLTNMLFALLVILLSFLIGRLFGLQGTILQQGRYALYVIAAWSVIRTPLVAYNNASNATQDLAANNMIGALLGVSRAVASLLFVLGHGGLFGLMLAGTVVEGCGSFLYKRRFTKMNPTLTPEWGVPDKALLKEMIQFGGHAMFLNVGNMLVFSSGSAIAGYVSGAAVASGFYTTQMPAMTGYNMATRLGESAAPAINDLWGRNERERLSASLVRLMRLTLLLTAPLAVGVLLFNKDLITAWVGQQQYVGFLLTACLAGFCLIAAVQRVAILYSFAFGWVRILTAAAACQGVGNCLLAVYLGRHYGLGGVTLALDLVLLPQTVILWRKLGTFLEIPWRTSLEPFLLRLVGVLILPTGLGLACHFSLAIEHRGPGILARVIGEIALFSIIYLGSAYKFLLSESEQQHVSSYLHKAGAALGMLLRRSQAGSS